VFKKLFSQLVNRMLENKSLHEPEGLPPRRECLWWIVFALLVKNSPLRAELKFRENTAEWIFLVGHPIQFSTLSGIYIVASALHKTLPKISF